MNEVEIINKDLEGFRGIAWHFSVVWEGKKRRKYYIASAVCAMFTGPEVLIFPSNRKGEVVSWSETYGERGTLSNEEVIKEFVKDAEVQQFRSEQA